MCLLSPVRSGCIDVNEFVAFLYGGAGAKASLDKAGSQVGAFYCTYKGPLMSILKTLSNTDKSWFFGEPKNNDKDQSKQRVKQVRSVRRSTS